LLSESYKRGVVMTTGQIAKATGLTTEEIEGL
jgi:hypothetical protein